MMDASANLPSTEPIGSLVVLSSAKASERGVRAVSVLMATQPSAEHLESFADTFGSGWLDPRSGQLCLQFHVVGVFSSGKPEALWLSVPGKDERIGLTPANIASPAIAQRYPQLPWSARARFVLDEVIELPRWAAASSRFDLYAAIAGQPVRLGGIHIGEMVGQTGLWNRAELPALARQWLPTASQRWAPAKAKLSAIAVRLRDRIVQMDRLFLMAVVVPTLLSTVYFGLIASDVYISESRFVVRTPQHQAVSGFGALLQGAGFSPSQDDTYSVHDYMLSRDALTELVRQFGLGKAFGSHDVDIFSRFAGLDGDDSFEALHKYYQKRVNVELDTLSSIATLSVSAFSPEIAYQMNRRLLELSEELVNRLNERGRQDMIRTASAEVEIAERRARNAALALSAYRNEKGVFNPEGQSALQLQQVSKIQEELIASQIELAQMLSLTKDNPQIPALKERIQSLKAARDAETAKVAGGNRSLSNKSAEYEGLALERSFAEKQLDAALTSLEQARSEAQRKQLYLERIVQPGKPDIAIEPHRIRSVFATLAIGLVAWGILTMLIAGVREHQD